MCLGHAGLTKVKQVGFPPPLPAGLIRALSIQQERNQNLYYFPSLFEPRTLYSLNSKMNLLQITLQEMLVSTKLWKKISSTPGKGLGGGGQS